MLFSENLQVSIYRDLPDHDRRLGDVLVGAGEASLDLRYGVDAKGEADAIYAKMEAQARGVEEILKKQAAGFAEIVKSAGGDADAALKLLIADKLEDLMKVQVDAIKNIKIDKVTVWDGGQNAEGKTSTANFISGMMKSVPPLDEVFTMAGMQLPTLLGKKVETEESAPAETTEA